MSTLPRITGKKLISILKIYGFKVVRIKGSHYFLKHVNNNKCTVVPVHAGEVIGIGLLQKILKDCELSRQQLQQTTKNIKK